MKLVLSLIVLVLSTLVKSEEIKFEIYELTNDGKKLLHKQNLNYTTKDIIVANKSGVGRTCSSKRLVLWEKFAINSCIYKERETTGFGLSIDENNGGFSWEWFNRNGGCDSKKSDKSENDDPNIYKKLQGSGSIRVEFVKDKGLKEIMSFEFLEDATMRGKLGFFGSFGGESHHIVIKKGSVLRFAKSK